MKNAFQLTPSNIDETTIADKPMTDLLYIADDDILNRAYSILNKRLSERPCFTSSDSVKLFCQCQLAMELDEHFCCLFLNSQHQLIKFERLFQGTIDGSSVYPRVILRRCLELNAAAVIFTHNHPSGTTTPSQADKSITVRLKTALEYIDVRVLDHLIVSQSETSSFAELGLI